MPNYPGALDALANPTPTTLRNEPGFSLAGAIGTLNDIAEALEAKLGIGASVPGAAAGVLRRTAAGASAWGAIEAADIAQGAISQWQQQQWTTQTTSSATAVGITNSFVTMTTTGGPVILLITGTVSHSGVGQYAALQGAYDSGGMGELVFASAAIANGWVPFSICHVLNASAASHSFGALWRTSAASAAIQAGLTTVMEIKR